MALANKKIFHNSRYSLVDQENQKSYPLDKPELTVGRIEKCDITIKDPKISRHHATLKMTSPGIWQLIDHGSSNGSYKNNEKLASGESVVLHQGDRIKFNTVEFVFNFEEVTKKRTRPLNIAVPEPRKASRPGNTTDSDSDSQNEYDKYPTASFEQRLKACLIDSLVLYMLLTALIGIGLLGQMFVMKLVYLPAYIYPYMMIFYDGQTIGKKILKIKIIHLGYPSKLNFIIVFKRETLGKLISFLFWPITLYMYFRNPDKKAFHDLISGTRVISVK